MSISKETMERLTALSKLELSQTELEQLSGELKNIIDYMDILSQLSVECTEFAETPSLLHNVYREDHVICSPDRTVLLSSAPETDGETLTVPKTVD